MLAAVRSSVSLPMAVLNSMRQLPQISYAATSTTLGKKNATAVVLLLFRTLPGPFQPMTGQARAAIDFFVTMLGTTHLGILYVQDEYGVDYQLALQQATAKRGIQTMSAAITWDPTSSSSSSSNTTTRDVDPLHDSMQNAIDQLLESGYRHFMAIVFSHHLERRIEMGAPRGLLGPGMSWLLADGISHRYVERLQCPADTPMARALQGLGILTTGNWSGSSSSSTSTSSTSN
jgi:Receptor family ligand binding region